MTQGRPDKQPGLGEFLRTGYLIHDVSRLRRQFYDQQSRHLGITRAQWWVLFNLSRHEGAPLNQNELAGILEIGSASLGELLGRLEKSGFIKRVNDSQDKRAKRILVADRGLEVLKHMREVARESNPQIMSQISSSEQTVLNELLAKMKQNLIDLLSDSDESSASNDDTQNAARGAVSPVVGKSRNRRNP